MPSIITVISPTALSAGTASYCYLTGYQAVEKMLQYKYIVVEHFYIPCTQERKLWC